MSLYLMESSLLACPICTQPGFLNIDSLCHGLIYASTREFLCPVCDDVLKGLDKFTIHLFSHSILCGQHVKGGESSNSEEVHSVLSSKHSEPLSLNLKKPLIIGDSFADFHVSTHIGEDSRQHKTVDSSLTKCSTHDLTKESSEHISVVSANYNESGSAVDHAGGGSASEIIENSPKENTCVTINNSEVVTKEFSDSESSTTVTEDSQQNAYTVLPPEDKVSCTDEFLLTKVTDIESNPEKHPSNGICNQFKSPGHYNNSSVVCDICQFSFTEETILEMHKQLIHSDLSLRSSDSLVESDNERNYPCLLCPKSFRMKGSLMVHVRVAHNGFPAGRLKTLNQREPNAQGDRSYTCNICDKSFKKENHLTQHMKTHEGKQWACDVCSKLFTTKYFLKKHKRLHTGEMPYRCGICDKTFTFQQSYHKHLLYHSDEKPHVCSECDRAFKELSTLHNHQRIHTGEKPFACETCGKCFRQRVSYLVHRRIHTGVMPYKCTACGKSFRYKVSQRTHKCPSQPPGTVVRQSSDLVQKLRQAVEIKPPQEKHNVINGVLPSDVKEGCNEQEKHHMLNKEVQLIEKQQSNEYIILANSHIQSTLSHDILLDSSPILWITGEVEKSQRKDTRLEALHVPQIVGLCNTQLHPVPKDCNDKTVARNYQHKYDTINETMDNNEMFYEGMCKDENDTNFVDQNKTAETNSDKTYNTKLENTHNASENRGMIYPSSESSDIFNIIMSTQSQSDDSKNPGVSENDEPLTMNIPVVFNNNAGSVYLPHNKQNNLAGYTSEISDLGSKSDVYLGNICSASVSQLQSQSKCTQECDSGTHEKAKYLSPSQQMLMLNEESLNLFYDADI